MSQNCLFICSPSVGLLDNWIPVLNKLKKQNFKIDIFFPKISTVEQFNTSNFLSKEAFKTFNNVIYQDLYDDLFIAKFNKKFVEDIGLNKTLKKTRSIIMRFINQEAFLGDKIFYALNNILIKLKLNHTKINTTYFKTYTFICYDMYEEYKPYIKKLNPVFKKIKKFSLHHGSDFPATNKNLNKKKINVQNVYPILFTNSQLEKNYYKNNFIFKNKLKSLGCPKHDVKWTTLVKKRKISFPFREKYVLLISRNVDNNYLPSKRKLKYLKIIKKIIIDRNYKLVVKLHPKEDSESGKNFFFKIFKNKHYNKKWKFSSEIPLALSRNAKFIVSFFSGVAVDMCAQKKTTIELLDLKGLEHKASKSDLFYDKFNNEPIFRVRKNGFVLGTSDEKQFKSKVNWVINNEKKSNEKFYSHFSKFYKYHKKASENVYNHIINNI